jgi:[ribosomal protein S5]-alanine N-acetyltransferase
VKILETERLILREIETQDAAFLFELLNSPKFLKYIGDRGVRTVEDAAEFIESRYRESYRQNGFGLYVVERSEGESVGICGFVKRGYLDHPDIGFAFLPEYEAKGYGFESAQAALEFGFSELGFDLVYAITSPDNTASEKLLAKLGFRLEHPITTPEGDSVNLHSWRHTK